MTPKTEQLIREAAEKCSVLPIIGVTSGEYKELVIPLLRALVQQAIAQAPANEDTELLDWLEKSASLGFPALRSRSDIDNQHSWWAVHFNGRWHDFPTARAAIRAAMKRS